MKFKSYPKYKDSGIDWIGEIPEGWEVHKIKHLTENFDGKRIPISAEKREDGKIPYYGATGVLDYVKDFIFNEELLLVGEDGAPFFEPFKDVAYIIYGKSWVNNHAHVLRVMGNNLTKWLCYYLNIYDYGTVIKGSTRDKLNQDQLSNMFVVKPSLKDQIAIASFLDKKIARIDALIEKDKKLIELLNEKRTTLINHTVTKGLDPNAKLKDSGINWIGEIPKGWEVRKVKHKYLVIDGDRGKEYPSENDLKDSGVPFLSAECIEDFKLFIDRSNFISEEKFHKLGRGKLKNKDIILTVRGTIGKAAVFFVNSYNRGFINAEMMILRKYDNLEYDYLFYIIFCDVWQRQVDYYSYGTAQKQLNNFILKNILIPIPSLSEQNKIVQFLDESTTKIDKTIKLIGQKINLLKEYKKSLIHHVVTGKVDVREV
jgi:type I restriction enzyme S subunit